MASCTDPQIEAEQRYAEDTKFAVAVDDLAYRIECRNWTARDMQQAAIVLIRQLDQKERANRAESSEP